MTKLKTILRLGFKKNPIYKLTSDLFKRWSCDCSDQLISTTLKTELHNEIEVYECVSCIKIAYVEYNP